METHDFAIVGGGILGASFAAALRARGQSVVLFERWLEPGDGSVRNFGLAWPFIVPGPEWVPRALRTLQIYRSLAGSFDFGFRQAGALVVASTDAEADLANRFASKAASLGIPCQRLDPSEALKRQPLLRPESTRLALDFPEAGLLDPRRFVAGWLNHLAQHSGLRLETGCQVAAVARDRDVWRVVTASGPEIGARQVLVCTGEDFQSLFPDLLRTGGWQRCKLQMLQTEPLSPAGGPALAFGRSLRFYRLLSQNDSHGHESKSPEPGDSDLDRYGIHLLIKPAEDGSLIVGDSHEDLPGNAPRDFDYTTRIEDLLLELTRRHLTVDSLPIRRRWLGYYARHAARPIFESHERPGLRLITGLTCGMSAGPGYAEDQVRSWLGE